MKHKHAELIKAWADGAKIEFYNVFQEWVDADNPKWKEGCIYRIKPEPKPEKVIYVYALNHEKIKFILDDNSCLIGVEVL